MRRVLEGSSVMEETVLEDDEILTEWDTGMFSCL